MKNAILFGNGEYEHPEYYQGLLKLPAYVVAVDGGLNFLDSIGVTPDLIIGDLDSVDSDLVEKYSECETLKLPVKKDVTDTEYAINQVVERGFSQNIYLAGMMGKRIDHTLANVMLLKRGAEDGVTLSLVSPDESVICAKGPADVLLLNMPGSLVTLLPMTDEVTGVTISGFDYPLENATLSIENPSRGVSNPVLEEMQTVAFESGILLIINSREINKPQT